MDYHDKRIGDVKLVAAAPHSRSRTTRIPNPPCELQESRNRSKQLPVGAIRMTKIVYVSPLPFGPWI
jgi:hypothetical protein